MTLEWTKRRSLRPKYDATGRAGTYTAYQQLLGGWWSLAINGTVRTGLRDLAECDRIAARHEEKAGRG